MVNCIKTLQHPWQTCVDRGGIGYSLTFTKFSGRQLDIFHILSRKYVIREIEKQSEVIKTFSSTSRYLDDVLNIDNKYFDGLISQTSPSEHQFNKVNSSET